MLDAILTEGAKIGLEHLSDRSEQTRLRRNARVQALATLFAATADCLDEIRICLESRDIPSGVGTRLQAHIVQYAFDARHEDFTPREQASISAVLLRIRSALTAADFQDKVLAGQINRDDKSEQERIDLFIDLKRAAGRLRGESDALRLHIQ